jgi:hypothetical protein
MKLSRHPLLAVLAVAACAFPVAAFALREDPAPAKEESESARKERKVRQLFELMGQRELMKRTTTVGTESFAKMGLPDSFTQSFLDRFDYDRMIDATVEVYVEKLEEATIDALVAFHASEQGKLYVAALPDISVETLRAGTKYGEELALEIVQGK